MPITGPDPPLAPGRIVCRQGAFLTDFPEIRAQGLDAAIVRFSRDLDDAANRATLAFAAILNEAPQTGVVEVAPALTSVLVRFDPLVLDFEELKDNLAKTLATRDWFASGLPAGRRLWTIPVAFGADAGPQAGEAAQMMGLSESELAAQLTQNQVRILALGFAPGQPYMGFLPPIWNIPRQSALTPTVPAGALVTAIRQLIIFSGPAPTGWWQIGTCGFRPFRPQAEDPIAFAPGDEVRFTLVGADELAGAGDGLGGATVEVAR